MKKPKKTPAEVRLAEVNPAKAGTVEDATNIFNQLFGTNFTPNQLLALMKETDRMEKNATKNPFPGNPYSIEPPCVAPCVAPQVESADYPRPRKPADVVIPELLHVATNDLIKELSNRSLGFLGVMATLDKDSRDIWTIAISGSPYLVNTLVTAAVQGGKRYIESGMREDGRQWSPDKPPAAL
jgi:hypothetical protein